MPSDANIHLSGELRRYAFEFNKQPELDPDQGGTDQLTGSPTITATPATTPPLTIGTPSVVGTRVVFTVSGGQAGQQYMLTCSVNTIAGFTCQKVGSLIVPD